MNVKLNDNVVVITGKYAGKQGKVIATSPKNNTVVVEGVNIHKKAKKARKANEVSQIVEVPGPIDASNVMVICPSCGKPTRVYYSVVDGKKVRIHGGSKGCGAVVDGAKVSKAAAKAAKKEEPKKRVRKRAKKEETAESGKAE